MNISDENLVTLAEAARSLPGRPSIPTLWRWCTTGVRGVRLGHVRLGRRIYTSMEALNDFANACALAATNRSACPAREATMFLDQEGF